MSSNVDLIIQFYDLSSILQLDRKNERQTRLKNPHQSRFNRFPTLKVFHILQETPCVLPTTYSTMQSRTENYVPDLHRQSNYIHKSLSAFITFLNTTHLEPFHLLVSYHSSTRVLIRMHVFRCLHIISYINQYCRLKFGSLCIEYTYMAIIASFTKVYPV